VKIVVGSTNQAKLKAAQIAVGKLFPEVEVKSVKVDSGVGDQPTSDKEAIEGAVNRAKKAQEKANADFGIGMEGGFNKVGKHYFECGWVAVVDKRNKIGLGSSARFELSRKIIKQLCLRKELADVINNFTGRRNANEKEGMMGLVTNKHLPRATAYSHGVLFAFAPFISDPKFWD
jgi:inosine/xanthosine triphosphatase